MSKRRRLAAVVAVVAASFAAGFTVTASGLVQPDFYPSLATYGVSAGTGSAYCSAELVHWLPVVSCERAS